MKPKYLLCSGEVTSASDGQRHYIGPFELARLYGVDYHECKIFDPARWWPESFWKEAERDKQELIVLKPRRDGNYAVPSNGQGNRPREA